MWRELFEVLEISYKSGGDSSQKIREAGVELQGNPNIDDDLLILCELASTEENPQKLLHLIEQINRALEECRPGEPLPFVE